MIPIQKRDQRRYRLRPSNKGRHQFGGTCEFEVVVPTKSETPLHQLLLIDLTDPEVPIAALPSLRSLPLLYPLKYGSGGASLQYSILDANRVEIL